VGFDASPVHHLIVRNQPLRAEGVAAKELQIFKEALPQTTRIGILWNPTTPSHGPAVQAMEAVGGKPVLLDKL
jgi:hypothetical protein